MTDAAFWDRIAPKYAAQPIKDPDAYEYTLGRTRSYLAPDDRVLELGCGTGSTALRLAPLVERYTASDLSGQMVAIGKGKALERDFSNLSFLAADWSHPRLLDEDYSVVLALNLLHLLPDLPTVLARINRLLPVGGYFISKTAVAPTQGAPLSYWAIRAILPVMKLLGRAPFVAFRQQAVLETMMENAGFDIVETASAPAQPPTRFIVARKL
jgi:ubiquinone/menaquinone biosynthesis C-methylase UbiE